MITLMADKFEIRDANGVVRVSIGTTEDVPVASYMFHFTRDGEYVDGVDVTMAESGSHQFLHKLANTYEGCHSWTFADQWHSMAAAALPYARWEPESESTVPECVRLAEYVRDKS